MKVPTIKKGFMSSKTALAMTQLATTLIQKAMISSEAIMSTTNCFMPMSMFQVRTMPTSFTLLTMQGMRKKIWMSISESGSQEIIMRTTNMEKMYK